MNPSLLKFKIAQLRQDKSIATIEAIMVVAIAFFGYVFLPQVIFQLFYAKAQLTEEPAVLKNMPLAIFAIATVYLVYAIVNNVLRTMAIINLERELMSAAVMGMGTACCSNCGGDCMCDDHGNCACGCGEAGKTQAEMKSASPSKMAEKMAKVGGKKKVNKKK